MKSENTKYPRQAVINFDEPELEQPVETVAEPARHEVTTGGYGQTPWFFVSLGSGSSGNCAYLGNETEGVLIDAGIDPDIVFDELKRHGITAGCIKGILLTHDHQDHVRYVYTIVRKNRHIPIYCTRRLMKGLLCRSRVSRRVQDYMTPIYVETPFTVAGMQVTAFETSHDGSDNMGFSLTREDRTFVVATDMGVITPRAKYYMSRANFLMIESNYDRVMLDTGRYPEMLKHRVRGDKGHLDNAVAAQFVAEHYHDGLSHVWLCHLSADNNRPEIAVAAMTSALAARGLSVGDGSYAPEQRDRDVQVYALPRFTPSTFFIL